MTLECVDKENYKIYINGQSHTSFVTTAYEASTYELYVETSVGHYQNTNAK
jgi:hypothetical protein